jgi:hypothetical protein
LIVPENLTVDIREGHLFLSASGITVDLEIGGRYGVFHRGPMPWSQLLRNHLAPALSVINETLNGRRTVKESEQLGPLPAR